MGRKLYVGNLPYKVDEGELTSLFEQFGTVDSVHVARDMATGQARGFAFVEMGTDQEAADAAAKLDGTELGGRALKVNEARPRESGGGGFGGGRGPGGGGGRGPGGRGGGGGGRGPRREPRW